MENKEVVYLPLRPGVFAIVDADCPAWIRDQKWYLGGGGGGGYARRNVPRTRDKEYLHRVITGCPEGFDVDHINGDRLDNRRINLRICSHRLNLINSKKRKVASSKFKGVCWHRKAKKWMVRVDLGLEKFYLGLYKDEIAAATAYNAKAAELFGEFAKLNVL